MPRRGSSTFVYISNAKVQVAQGSFARNRINVENLYTQELEEGSILNGILMNSYSLEQVLTDMWRKNNLPTSGVYLVVNDSSITVRQLKIPPTPEKNVPMLIRGEFRDMDDIQNMLVDFTVINPALEDGSVSIMACLSPKDFINNYIELFKNVNVELQCIDLVQNTLLKITRQLSSLKDKTFAVFVLDRNMLMQVLFVNGEYKMTRRSRILASPDEPNYENEIGRNINTLIQFHKSEQTGTDISDFYLCGFPSEIQGYFPNFKALFDVNVTTFPEYQPAELVFPAGQNPADWIVLLGAMIRYSD